MNYIAIRSITEIFHSFHLCQLELNQVFESYKKCIKALTLSLTAPGSSTVAVRTLVVHVGLSSLTSLTSIVTDAEPLRGVVPPSVALTVKIYCMGGVS